MAGLVPAIHVFGAQGEMWMPAPSVGMTIEGLSRMMASAANQRRLMLTRICRGNACTSCPSRRDGLRCGRPCRVQDSGPTSHCFNGQNLGSFCRFIIRQPLVVSVETLSSCERMPAFRNGRCSATPAAHPRLIRRRNHEQQRGVLR